MPFPRPRLIVLSAALLGSCAAAGAACEARSPATRTPVIELYTSEGCSSCPPVDRWLSTLKDAAAEGRVVAQAFHVSYWDYIGWIDRFAAPAHTRRQRQLAADNGLGTIYTPQLVRDGRDWRGWGRSFDAAAQPAGARIRMARSGDAVEAEVALEPGTPWSAYWTVTEHGHASKVSAGENAGEVLRHDFVVRQYVPAGRHEGTQKLRLRPVAAAPGHPQQVNLVVFDPRTGRPLQGLSLACGAASG